ncbi:MAG: flagellar basal body-associated FliL family protein, partial [Gemmatimonadaceae bacterium]
HVRSRSSYHMSDESVAPAENEAPPAKGLKGPVLIGALVGALLLGSAAGVFAVGHMLAKKSGYNAIPGADSAGAHGDTAEAGEHGAGKDSSGGGANGLHVIDNLVLNPAGSGGSRFLMLAAAVEFSDAKRVEELKAREPEARDILLRVMGARTVEELTDMKIRESLKVQLTDSLSVLFDKPKQIRRVYFPQFVIQ